MDSRSQRRSGPLSRALLWYVRKFPAHAGKWKIVRALARDPVGGPKALDGSAPHVDSIEVRLGLRWQLDRFDYTQAKLFWYGELDHWVFWHIRRLIRNPAVILDIGANFGYYGIVLARAYPSVVVHSFEPNPSTFARLRKNIELNSLTNVIPHRQALSSQYGWAGVVEQAGNSGAAFLSNGNDVETVTLDGFCDANQIRTVSFLKIDIEGYEPRFLAGAKRSLREFRPIMVIEINPPVLNQRGSDAQSLIGSLRELGYRLMVVKRRKLAELTHVPPDEVTNAVCLPR